MGSTVFDNGVSKEQGYLVPIIQSYTDITCSILYYLPIHIREPSPKGRWRHGCLSLALFVANLSGSNLKGSG